MYTDIDENVNFLTEHGIDIETINRLEEMRFFEKPASTKYHGAYTGGLFEHSLTVAMELVNLTERLDLKWELERSPFLVGLLHDICKCDNYVEVAPDKWEYSKDIIIPGHGDKSVMMIQHDLGIELTEEELCCIRWHMGAYETDTKMWEYYGRSIERYPNVLYTHTADMIASKIRGI